MRPVVLKRAQQSKVGRLIFFGIHDNPFSVFSCMCTVCARCSPCSAFHSNRLALWASVLFTLTLTADIFLFFASFFQLDSSFFPFDFYSYYYSLLSLRQQRISASSGSSVHCACHCLPVSLCLHFCISILLCCLFCCSTILLFKLALLQPSGQLSAAAAEKHRRPIRPLNYDCLLKFCCIIYSFTLNVHAL